MRRFDLSLEVPADRARFIDAYSAWVGTCDAQYEWAEFAMHDAIWREVEPEIMIEIVIDVVNRFAGDDRALNYIGAGPLEDLLGGKELVMERVAEEARGNQALRTALATDYGVRFCEPGYEALHELAAPEIERVYRLRKILTLYRQGDLSWWINVVAESSDAIVRRHPQLEPCETLPAQLTITEAATLPTVALQLLDESFLAAVRGETTQHDEGDQGKG